MGGSVGGSKSDSNAKYDQSVWSPQGDALQNMYGQASDLFNNLGQYTGQIDRKAQELDPYMKNIMDQASGGYQSMLGGGSVGNTDDIRAELMKSMRSTAGGSNMGKMYNSIVGGQGNEYIDPMVDAMKSGSMDNLQRMQAGTGLDAAAAGQGGSSRHAMQNAMQSSEANKDMLNREMTMRGGAYDKDLGMKMDIARQADSGIQATQDRLASLLGSADQNVGQGLQYGQGMQNLGMGSMSPWMQAAQVPYSALGQYANALGSPTVLGQGSQSGSSKGGGASGSIYGG